jgi:hypothetical protein
MTTFTVANKQECVGIIAADISLIAFHAFHASISNSMPLRGFHASMTTRKDLPFHKGHNSLKGIRVPETE